MKKIEINNDNPNILICTYGTLRVGQGNYNHLLRGKSEYMGTFKTNEEFTMYGKGCGFPIVTPDGNTAITYDLFKVTDNNVLNRIHSLEGFSGIMNHPDNWYNVTEIETPHGLAYMYVQDEAWSANSLIETGNWLNQELVEEEI